MRYIRHGLCGKCGVYLITCRVNGKRYVGSSIDVGKRVGQHFSRTCIERYSRINPFYADIGRYGRDAFEIQLLETCSRENKYEVEAKWYDILTPEYNLVRPDDCPLIHPEVVEKSKTACATEEGRRNRVRSHQTKHCKNRCREIQVPHMKACRAVAGDGSVYDFESRSVAARWLNRPSALPSVISNISDAINRRGQAFGYRWEAI